jgi:D-3-phosphoglycerate dehydrogenase / 2-oxoglutarate reductase
MKLSFPKEKIKVVLFENIHINAVNTFQKMGYTNIETLDKALSEDELIEKIKDVRIIGIRSKTKLTRRILESAEKLQAVACFCIGTNQVDLKCAAERGIAVFNSPYSNTRSVAELVIAEIISIMRGLQEKSMSAHRGGWLKVATNSFEVRNKTLGIIGYGHIGAQVSVLAEAMGMKVIYYDVVSKLPMGNARAVDTLEELLGQSDMVTLHVPGTPETKEMITAKELAQMKKGAGLLNLSRGNVIVIDDLKAALESGHLRGAALDVFPAEPKSTKDKFVSPLQGLDNVILTPHIGGSTEEAQENIGIDAATKLANYMDTGSTIGSHSIPELHLPIQKNTSRILHIHENKAGVMAAINNAVSELGLNITGQYLKTNEIVGYVVLDFDQNESSQELLEKLSNIKHTIRTRLLY